MRRLLACVSLAGLLASGCGVVGESDRAGIVDVDPKKVTGEELKAAVSDQRVKRFYAARGWAPLWTDELVDNLTAAFQDAPRHALNPAPFIKDTQAGATPAEREAALTLAALNYARALATGALDPRKVWEVYSVPLHGADVASGLQQAAQKGEVRQWLASLPPQDAEYRSLSDAYLTYSRRADRESRAAIPRGDKIEPGDRDPRLPEIAAALRSNGYLASPSKTDEAAGKQQAATKPVPDPTRYSPEMAGAVKRLQTEYGIKPDGVIGDDTVEALNTGADERARILAVNLERRRWLERDPPATRIDVNTAATTMVYWRDGNLAHQARVVVGQPKWETPQLGSPIVRLVANPPWTVPESIAEKEILPKGAGYMARENMSFKNGRIVQAPGPKSALGLVKFDMNNPHAIYLHDTPAKALFASEERHASHGCTRVQDAIGFARLLATHDGKLERFNKALASGKESSVELSAEVPVRMLYHTAYVDGGRVVFLHDDYGWDDQLAKALGIKGELRRRARQYPTDVGP